MIKEAAVTSYEKESNQKEEEKIIFSLLFSYSLFLSLSFFAAFIFSRNL